MSGRVLVTGAAGFIGSHVCAALLDRQWHVSGLDNFDPFYARSIKEEGLLPLEARERFQLIEADIRDGKALDGALADVDVVIHLAARAGVRPSIEDPELYTSVNVGGTTSVLEACRRNGVRRVVFGSSSSVYGDTAPVPFDEGHPAVDPISPYAATKRAGELLCRVYSHLHGIRIAALRFFTVYGDRQRPDLAIHKFTRLMAERRPIPQYGDGTTERDYTYATDIVAGVCGAVEWTANAAAAFDTFNLGGARTVPLHRLIALIGDALGVQPRIDRQPPMPGDVRRTYAAVDKARQALGYDPVTTIEEGIPRFVRWYEAAYGRSS